MILILLLLFSNTLGLAGSGLKAINNHLSETMEMEKDINSCAYQILKKYFSDKKHFLMLNSEDAPQTLDSDLSRIAFEGGKLEYVEIDLEVDFPEKRIEVNYVINVHNSFSIYEIVKSIWRSKIWKFSGKILIIVHNMEITAENIQSIFEVLNSYRMYNAIVLVPSKKGLDQSHDRSISNILLYTYFPYSEDNCGDIVKEVLVDTWQGNQFLYGENLYPNKVKNLHGCRLTFVVPRTFLGYYNYTILNKPMYPEGQEQGFLSVFSQTLNFTIEKVHQSDFNDSLSLNDIYEDEHSGIMGFIYLTTIVREYLYTHDIILLPQMTYLAFLVPLPNPYPFWMNLYFPYDHFCWILITVCFFLVVVIMTHTPYCYQQTKSMSPQLSVLYNLSIALGISVPQMPQTNFMRFVFAFWVLSLLVINAGYQGSLFSFTTNPKIQPPIDTKKDLLDSELVLTGDEEDGYILYNFEDEISKEIYARWIDTDYDCETMENISRYAILMSYDTIEEMATTCKLLDKYGKYLFHITSDKLSSGSLVFNLNRNSPFTEGFQFFVDISVQAGLAEIWKWQYRVMLRYYSQTHYKFKEKEETEALTFQHLSGSFFLLLFGLVFSLLAILSELTYPCVKRKVMSKCSKKY